MLMQALVMGQRLIRQQQGGISTYVATAVLIAAVLAAAFGIILASENLGHHIVAKINAFISLSE